MKVIIPAKQNSTRVINKNWRNFHHGKNLVEIKIEQLLKSVPASDIFLSTDYKDFEKTATNYGIHFIPRNPVLASDDTPWADAFSGMIGELPLQDHEDIAWVEVINPLFDAYDDLFKKWQEIKHTHDSLVLTSQCTKFLLKSNGQPLNFMCGKWHQMSQNMEPLFAWDSVCIMNKKNMMYFGYPIGKTPYLYSHGDTPVDIDSMQDFEMAQLLYIRKFDNENK